MENYVFVEYSYFRYPRGFHGFYSFRGAFRAGFRGGRPYFRGNWRGCGNLNGGVYHWGDVQHRAPQQGGYQREGRHREAHQRSPGYHAPEGVGGLNRKQRRLVAQVLKRYVSVEQRPLLQRVLIDVLQKHTCNRSSTNDQPNEEEQPQEQELANEHLQEQANEHSQEPETAN